jgi:hypothetical protein
MNPNPLSSKAEQCRNYINLRILNLNHFKKVEATGLEDVEMRFPTVS